MYFIHILPILVGYGIGCCIAVACIWLLLRKAWKQWLNRGRV